MKAILSLTCSLAGLVRATAPCLAGLHPSQNLVRGQRQNPEHQVAHDFLTVPHSYRLAPELML